MKQKATQLTTWHVADKENTNKNMEPNCGTCIIKQNSQTKKSRHKNQHQANYDSSITMNCNAIDLNNRGVAELQSGDVVSAFQSLSKAANNVMVGIENHVHVNAGADVFHFHWIDCSAECSQRKCLASGSTSWEGCAPFLFLRALKVTTSCSDEEVENLCPCGYAWVIWFNLALCCSVIGTRLGEKGRLFLEMGHDLYEKVQRRVHSEPPNKHWQVLAMAVFNNQACIFHDFSMQTATFNCLQRLAYTLSSCPDIEVCDRGDFCLNLQILGSQTMAPAA